MLSIILLYQDMGLKQSLPNEIGVATALINKMGRRYYFY